MPFTPTAGVAFKPQHIDEATASSAAGLWFEVHAENYMVDGGPRLAMLEALREARSLSLHGVGLSLGGAEPPDEIHLAALARLVDRFEPFLVSEHLAWSRLGGQHYPALLPVPRTRSALVSVARNIDIVQEAIGRAILIENPALYLPAEGCELDEPEFLRALIARTGCGLLVDVTNVAVAANNVGYSAERYLCDLPHDAIGEIHLAGYGLDPVHGAGLLIDSHDAPVAEPVWALLDLLIDLAGPRPVLIERDADIPDFAALMAERDRAAGATTRGRILTHA
jgi:uncharacterized protein (UPF0276 family)